MKRKSIKDNNNVRILGGDYTIPLGRYNNREPEDFIGKIVKKGFVGENEDGVIGTEHMWVSIYAVEDGKLLGVLSNDPVCISPDVLKNGDNVQLTVYEIEDVYGEQ